MSFQADAILAALHRHGVEYVLIGGFAAVVHGSPLLTSDVDITPQAHVENLSRLSAALIELDARVRAEGTEPLPLAHDAASLAASAVWNLTTRFGDLDISMVPSGTRGYDDLRRDAVEVRVKGVPVLLASLADVVCSKSRCGARQGPPCTAGTARAARPTDARPSRLIRCPAGRRDLAA